jgi:hypothetical protein
MSVTATAKPAWGYLAERDKIHALMDEVMGGKPISPTDIERANQDLPAIILAIHRDAMNHGFFLPQAITLSVRNLREFGKAR